MSHQADGKCRLSPCASSLQVSPRSGVLSVVVKPGRPLSGRLGTAEVTAPCAHLVLLVQGPLLLLLGQSGVWDPSEGGHQLPLPSWSWH